MEHAKTRIFLYQPIVVQVHGSLNCRSYYCFYVVANRVWYYTSLGEIRWIYIFLKQVRVLPPNNIISRTKSRCLVVAKHGQRYK